MAEEPISGRTLKMRIVKTSKRGDSRYKERFDIFAVVPTPGFSDSVTVSSNSIEGNAEKAVAMAKSIAEELQEELFIFGYTIVIAN